MQLLSRYPENHPCFKWGKVLEMIKKSSKTNSAHMSSVGARCQKLHRRNLRITWHELIAGVWRRVVTSQNFSYCLLQPNAGRGENVLIMLWLLGQTRTDLDGFAIQRFTLQSLPKANGHSERQPLNLLNFQSCAVRIHLTRLNLRRVLRRPLRSCAWCLRVSFFLSLPLQMCQHLANVPPLTLKNDDWSVVLEVRVRDRRVGEATHVFLEPLDVRGCHPRNLRTQHQPEDVAHEDL
mmetsp:Transcript_22132/g.58635  ORF Transcript_22132/g.58635 Transcript_22132/m.58635 type:complete len:236 (-) Transcript_22132:391-1098(-)